MQADNKIENGIVANFDEIENGRGLQSDKFSIQFGSKSQIHVPLLFPFLLPLSLPIWLSRSLFNFVFLTTAYSLSSITFFLRHFSPSFCLLLFLPSYLSFCFLTSFFTTPASFSFYFPSFLPLFLSVFFPSSHSSSHFLFFSSSHPSSLPLLLPLNLPFLLPSSLPLFLSPCLSILGPWLVFSRLWQEIANFSS